MTEGGVSSRTLEVLRKGIKGDFTDFKADGTKYEYSTLFTFTNDIELVEITRGNTNSIELYIPDFCRLTGITKIRFRKKEAVIFMGNDKWIIVNIREAM